MSTSVSYEQSLFLLIVKHKFVGNIMKCNFVDGLITFSHKEADTNTIPNRNYWFESLTNTLTTGSLHNWAQSSVKCDYNKNTSRCPFNLGEHFGPLLSVIGGQ